ncbi:MAG: aldo/keto reductase [Dehalococcoidia bacterium]
MKYRNLGNTGLKVSELCLGTMTFGNQTEEPEAHAIISAAADAGVNFIDTANVYPIGSPLLGRTEEIVGNWLKGRRSEYVLATKCTGVAGPGPNDHGSSRRHIMEAVEGSLRRLQTDYIDVYQMHQPDPTTPLEETARAMSDLVEQGKVRYIGVSNYPGWKIALMLGMAKQNGWHAIVSDQPRYNLLYREIETEIVPLCLDQGVGIMAYNPLAGGFLSGRYVKGQDWQEGTRFGLAGGAGENYRRRYWQDAQFDVVADLQEYFSARGRNLAQVAVNWVANRPGITSAIVGASRAEQIKETLPAVDIELTDEELAFINEAWYRIPRPSDPAVANR